MRFFRIFTVLLVALCALPALAQDGAPPYVKIRVLPERGVIKPDETIWIGIEQSIAPGWHTYWKNPGDSGAAPRVTWTLPAGFIASDIHWPAPHKLKYGPLLNYGYSDHVILLQQITAPASLNEGPQTLAADIEVLVCKEECIPEKAVYEITLNGPEGASEDNAEYLNAALEKLPKDSAWAPMFNENGDIFSLSGAPPQDEAFAGAKPDSLEFFPEDWGVIENSAPAALDMASGIITITQRRGDQPIDKLEKSRGLLAFTTDSGERRAIAFTAVKGEAPASALQPEPDAAKKLSLLQAILFAVFGGIILNLMPCVFPVLSIKALSLVKISEKDPGLARLHGISYTAGVILSFVAIAAILLALKAGGAGIGWGFQLQNPVVVTLLAYLLFIIGLNLAGVFDVYGQFGTLGHKLTQGEGLSASFFTGILATLVATPCTAPFMAGAIGFALLQPAAVSLAIFAALGFGLALPYLLLSFVPALRSFLPRPGAWMEIFRQLLAFPMFASAAWLVWVVAQQTGAIGLLGALLGMVLIAFGIWVLHHQPHTKRWHITIRVVAALAFLLALGFLPSGQHMEMQHPAEQSSFGDAFTTDKLAQALEGDGPVFTEMTAAWCITCKVNHAVAINVESTRALFAENRITYLIGDWTNQDPVITEYLDSFGRNGVPLYVYYGPRDKTSGARPKPQILPQVLTPGIVEEYVTAQ